MVRRVELLAVSAKRFMRASAWNTPQDCFIAVAVVVAIPGASRTFLTILALECLMANLLAVVALIRSRSAFEYAGRARLSSGMEEALCDESPCVITFGQIYHH
jgi:hypothetical protein